MDTLRKTIMLLALGSGLLGGAGQLRAAEATHVGTIADGLTAPTSLLVTTDNIAVLEPFSGQLVLYSTAGVVSNRFTISREARGLARLAGPDFLFCEGAASRVVRVNPDTGTQSVFLSDVGVPTDVIVAGGLCRVLDAAGQRVLLSDASGRTQGAVVLAVPGTPTGSWLSDLAWDGTRERYYAWDQTHSRVLAFAADGAFEGEFCSFGADAGTVTRGGEIVCDAEGWIYVSDRFQGRIAVFDAAWNFVLNIRQPPEGAGRLEMPSGLAVDATGLVYVACTEGPVIEVFHVDKTGGPSLVPRARPLSPAAGDTLAGAVASLLAGIQAPVALAAGLTAEFRVFALPDTTESVLSVTGLPVQDVVVAGDNVVGTVSWELPAGLTAGRLYGWTVRAVATGGSGEWALLRSFTKGALPSAFRLNQNVPNPFNPRTIISFELAGGGSARLAIYNLRGQQVWQRSVSDLGPGRHEVIWDGRNGSGAGVSSGVYFYRLVEGSRTETRKMVLMR